MTAFEVVVPLAPGFEEIEAVAVVDVLRRAGLRTAFAGLEPGSVEGSHGIGIRPDVSLDDVVPGPLRAVVLPGGMPGSARLRDDLRVRRLLVAVHAQGGVVAAVCAAPIALSAAGLLVGRKAVCFPGFESQLTGADVREDRVMVDDRIVTARGAGVAIEFALAVVALLIDESTARRIGASMLVLR